ncbi:hypothetical protein LTR56_007410 [Elasticomyces elasticus]|nr:hypothetical protein LTR56_007410 [Elasticomyces elasticus]KAK3668050.1 hypothetical protein LTR22_001118 [Elasticomyces elasticus]KAK4925198.1 hypothetical protein LTR49_007736 [Elasticomyces elasticus]KAK5767690.1 hypothetical protein LTS12_002192 [Elasticomyces elasticus]
MPPYSNHNLNDVNATINPLNDVYLRAMQRRARHASPTPTPTTGASTSTADNASETDYGRLKTLISQPESQFSPTNSLHKSVWSAELTTSELQALHRRARKQLEQAMKTKVRALEIEIDKLTFGLSQQAVVVDREDVEGLKGDVCKLVLEQWSHEKAVEEMTGMEAGGRHRRHDR